MCAPLHARLTTSNRWTVRSASPSLRGLARTFLSDRSVLQREADEVERKREPSDCNTRQGQADMPGRGLPAPLAREGEPAISEGDDGADGTDQPKDVQHVEPGVEVPVVGPEI